MAVTPTPSAKARRWARLTSMPIYVAASGLSAAARSDFPSLERLMRRVSATIVAIEITAEIPRDLLMKIETRPPHKGPSSQTLAKRAERHQTRNEPKSKRP